MVKKKNPQDLTLRNLRALKKRVLFLELGLKFVLRKLDSLPTDASDIKTKRR